VEAERASKPKCRVVKVSSDSGVKLGQAPQAVATVNGPAIRRYVHRREEEEIAFALVVPFKMMMFDIRSQRSAQRSFSKENELGQAFFRTELTQRSAKAFRFGLRGGRANGRTPLESQDIQKRKGRTSYRSWRRYGWPQRSPVLSSVVLRAIWSIHSEVGCLVKPARVTRRDSRWMKNRT